MAGREGYHWAYDPRTDLSQFLLGAELKARWRHRAFLCHCHSFWKPRVLPSGAEVPTDKRQLAPCNIG